MKAPSPRIETILCPTDFSPYSVRALRHAVAVAREARAKLAVVHVIPGLPSIAGTAPLPDTVAALIPEARRHAEQELERFVAPAVDARVLVVTEVRDGEPWRELRAAAEELPADLVVMGTHGRSGFERFVLGSVTEKLLRLLPCPVLSVCHEEGRTWEAPGLVRRLLYATDLTDFSFDSLAFALALAPRQKVEVTLLHVVEELGGVADSLQMAGGGQLGPEIERIAGERLGALVRRVEEQLDVAVRGRLTRGRAWREILRLAAEESADLVAIGPGHGAFEQLLFGSDAHHVVREATCPVLTVRPTRRITGRTRGESALQVRDEAATAAG